VESNPEVGNVSTGRAVQGQAQEPGLRSVQQHAVASTTGIGYLCHNDLNIRKGPTMVAQTQILAVDDDKELTSILKEQLTQKGYGVTVATYGGEAIGRVRDGHFDIVLLDLKMPVVSGFETLPFLKTFFPQTKVIVLTAYADLQTVQKCKKLGADDVIGKPYDLEELFEAIERVTAVTQ
jgi:CheY-like chemotaxis protein